MSDDSPRRKSGWVFRAILITGLLLIVMSCLGAIPPPLLVALYLPFAWIGYLYRVVPQVKVNGGGVLTAAVCAAGSLVLIQVLAGWLWRGLAQGGAWKIRWTVTVMGLIVLMFVAGTAMVGMTHQTAWMIRSPQPMFTYGFGRESANRVKCASNMRQICVAIRLYADENGGKFPSSLGVLVTTGELDYPSAFVCPSGEVESDARELSKQQLREKVDQGQTAYAYFGRGFDITLPADTPILTESLQNHDGDGMNIGFADGHVDWFPPDEAERLLTRSWGRTGQASVEHRQASTTQDTTR